MDRGGRAEGAGVAPDLYPNGWYIPGAGTMCTVAPGCRKDRHSRVHDMASAFCAAGSVAGSREEHLSLSIQPYIRGLSALASGAPPLAPPAVNNR